MSQEFYFHGQHFRLKWSGMKYSFECWMIWWCTLWWCRHTVHNKHLKNATFVILSTRQTKNTDARTWAAGYRFYLHTHFVWFYIAHRSIHNWHHIVLDVCFVCRLVSSRFIHSAALISSTFGSSQTNSIRRNIIHFWRAWHTQMRIHASVIAWLYLMSVTGRNSKRS